MTLIEALDDPARRAAIAVDLAKLVDDQVAAGGGMSGVALRTGYAAFKRVRPGMVRAAIDRLLPEMARALDPHWAAATAGPDPERSFADRSERVAQDLLAVTDRLAERSSNRVLTRLYASLRSSAQRHVAAAVPALVPVIRAHTSIAR